MTPRESFTFVISRLSYDVARFYGAADHLALGRGLIYIGVHYPIYDDDRSRFRTAKGAVLVVTHECNVSQENERPYNDDVLVCPLMPFDLFSQGYEKAYGEKKLKEFLGNMAKNRVSRLMYFPRIEKHFKYGAVIFFNQVCGTKVRAFGEVDVAKIAALGPYGEFEILKMINNHFLRPKQQMLSPSLH